VTSDQPLVSIFSFCKNRASTIRRSIDSVLNQSYRNIEFVVQDGASTDGTVEILKSYNDPRIKIVSAPDTGPAEAFWKAMNRCEGELIGTCLSDDELLPGAIEKAVELFRQHPDAGAITCDGWVTDETGKIIGEFNAGEFNLVDYLFGKYCPFWPGSFFRRQALIDVGLKSRDWNIECLEFETWCRLGTRHVVKYMPVRLSKYAVHSSQLSNTRQYYQEHFDNRAKVIREMFSASGFFGEDPIKLNGCLYSQLYLLYNHVRTYGLADKENLVLEQMKQLMAGIPMWDYIRYRKYFNFLDGSKKGKAGTAIDNSSVFRTISNLWLRVVLALPTSIRTRFPTRAKELVRKFFTNLLYVAITAKHSLRNQFWNWRKPIEQGDLSVAIAPEFSPLLYQDVAALYYARGQVAQALENWKKAEALDDATIDGIACQARLMLPEATYETLLESQRRWAKKHAKPIPSLPPRSIRPYDGKRKIRVGYYSYFMHSYVMRVIALSVLKHIDRERFEIYGYAPSRPPVDVEGYFDKFMTTGNCTDREFVELARSHQLDIFVETTGFSPLNRFSAMASRCAPIQISYLNHTGTSGVPNVDYVLADEISVLPGEDQWFTEKVWRLPGSFLCYNYDDFPMPPVAERPSKSQGYVTFGCFGSGGKINDDLIALWSKILIRSPGSKLFLRNGQLTSDDNRQFMIDRFRRHGIEESRLRLMGGTSHADLMKCFDEVDISLDTWPYCGGNTVAEPIWQGVPVVTLKGNRFSGRYGASLVAAAGCPDLIAGSPDEYVNLAVSLSEQPGRLDYYRANLRKLSRESGLVDAERFARNLSAAFVEMMNILQQR